MSIVKIFEERREIINMPKDLVIRAEFIKSIYVYLLNCFLHKCDITITSPKYETKLNIYTFKNYLTNEDKYKWINYLTINYDKCEYQLLSTVIDDNTITTYEEYEAKIRQYLQLDNEHLTGKTIDTNNSRQQLLDQIHSYKSKLLMDLLINDE